MNLTALQLAAKKGHTEVVELLIKAGAAVDVGDQVTQYHIALVFVHFPFCNRLSTLW